MFDSTFLLKWSAIKCTSTNTARTSFKSDRSKHAATCYCGCAKPCLGGPLVELRPILAGTMPSPPLSSTQGVTMPAAAPCTAQSLAHDLTRPQTETDTAGGRVARFEPQRVGLKDKRTDCALGKHTTATRRAARSIHSGSGASGRRPAGPARTAWYRTSRCKQRSPHRFQRALLSNR